MSTVVNGIIVRDGAILLCKRRHGRPTYPDCWGLPGGHVEPGETLEDALIREIREEMGVTPIGFRKMDVIAEAEPRANSETTYHIYLVSAWQGGDPVMLGDEHSEIRWVEIDVACDLPDLALAAYTPLFRSLLAPYRPGVRRPVTARVGTDRSA